jgi:hypothetical protein
VTGEGVNPVRDDGATMLCRLCGTAFVRSGRRRYCSTTCRQAAWRRQAELPAEPVVAKPDTVYECPLCESRMLGVQRCEDCNVFARRLGPGGPCPCCDEPISVSELLAREQFVRADRPQAKRRR